MRWLSSCVLLAALVHPRSRQEERPSIAEEIDALIEKTDAYQRFRAVYEMVPESEGRERSTLELTYVAPDRAGLCASGDVGVAGARDLIQGPDRDEEQRQEMQAGDGRHPAFTD